MSKKMDPIIERQIDYGSVEYFSQQMKQKLDLARAKGMAGWYDEERCTIEELEAQLKTHIAKGNEGNYLDIANFAMMIHLRKSGEIHAANTVRAPGFSNDLISVYFDHAEWSNATFGDEREKGPIGPIKHLKLECDEAAESLSGGEFADLQLLVWDSARRAGFNIFDLMFECREKLKVIKRRIYPKVPDGEPSLHVKDEGE